MPLADARGSVRSHDRERVAFAEYVRPMFLPPAEFVQSPEAMRQTFSVEEGRAYTRWLAAHHYENFHVVSFLLPKRLHQDFYNVYSYCRWADDLGDEIGDRVR